MTRKVLVLILGVVTAMPVMAADSNWSVAVDAGWATYTNPDSAGQPGLVTNVDNHQSGYRLLAAYRFDRYFGLEGGYAKFDQEKVNDNCMACNFDVRGYTNANIGVENWQVAGIADYPFTDAWALFGRLGVTDAKVTDQGVSYCGSCVTGYNLIPFDESDTSLNLTYGIGISRTVSRHVDLRLNWDRYANLGDKNTIGQYSINFISLGVQYSF